MQKCSASEIAIEKYTVKFFSSAIIKKETSVTEYFVDVYLINMY